MKKSFTILIATLTLLALMTRSLTGLGQTTYTFTSTAWADESNSWSSDKNGSAIGDSRGIAVQKAASGAGATTKNSVSNITSITINAAKSNKGVGSIDVYVGDEIVLTQSSFNTTSTNYTVNFNSAKSGKVSFVVTCTTSTIYVKSVTITNSSGPATFSVTYNANGGTGTVPTDSYSPYNSGATVTVLGNIGSPALAKDHYTFNGWNTKDDGTGTSYTADNTFTISQNTTLYAKWNPNTNTVTLPGANTYGTYTLGNSISSPVAYGTEVTLVYTPASGYENFEATWSVKDSDNNTVTVNNNKFTMPDAAVTVTVSVELNQWVETSLADLNPADVFVIVGTVENGTDNFETYALPNNGGSSAPIAESITIDENQIDGKPADKLKWNITGNAKDGYTFYPAGLSTTWLFCATNANSSSNNNMQVGSGTQQGINRNVFVLDDDDYLLTNDNKVDRYLSIYINSGTAQDWRGYVSSSTSPTTISFYKKVSANETQTLDIDGCGNNAGKYVIISSPVASVTPTADNGFITDNYDLYRFNQSAENEWENWKQTGTHYHFNIISGSGYLYASQKNTQLEFTGQPYNGNGLVGLIYDEDAPNFVGLNLIGNPLSTAATINKDYYRINTDGSDVTAGEGSIAPMEGVFVFATAVNQTAKFTVAAGKDADRLDNSQIILNVIGNNNNLIDRAIVRFNESDLLPKFMLNESNTKIYIPQDGSRYAIVQSEGIGTMPVNFKAKQMGKYTISVNTEGIDMDYLHLIDRLTGVDVNLLLDNSYSFIASAQDVESRFILSFTAKGYNHDADEPFAFQNGSDIIVNGTGELQIFDLMGRMVSTQNVNGIETINVKSQGVYIFRLNEKTQKIVVR